MMFAEERQAQILERLRAQGKVTVEELTQVFSVSAATVRADLATLEGQSLLRRTHGGALAVTDTRHEPPFLERAETQAEEKRRIGVTAAAMVMEGETILLDAGTTTHEIGRALAASGKTGITVVTNNLPTALLLMDAPGIETLVIGGHLEPRRRAMLGPVAVEGLKSIRVDRLFLAVNGVDPVGGLTAADFEAVQVKKAMLHCASSVIIVADGSKIGRVAFVHIAPLSAATLLLTDAPLPDDMESALLEAGLPAVQAVSGRM